MAAAAPLPKGVIEEAGEKTVDDGQDPLRWDRPLYPQPFAHGGKYGSHDKVVGLSSFDRKPVGNTFISLRDTPQSAVVVGALSLRRAHKKHRDVGRSWQSHDPEWVPPRGSFLAPPGSEVGQAKPEHRASSGSASIGANAAEIDMSRPGRRKARRGLTAAVEDSDEVARHCLEQESSPSCSHLLVGFRRDHFGIELENGAIRKPRDQRDIGVIGHDHYEASARERFRLVDGNGAKVSLLMGIEHDWKRPR